MAKPKKKASTKPSGLGVSRNGNKFKLSWKIPKGGYTSQKLKYHWKIDGKWQKWINGWDHKTKADDNKKTKSLSVSCGSFSNYYPATTKHLQALEFAVGGTRSDTSKINYTFSGWATFQYDINAPNVPSMRETVDTETAYKCTFTSTTTVSDTDSRPYYRGRFETCLVRENGEQDGGKVFSSAKKVYVSQSDPGGWNVTTAPSGGYVTYSWAKQEDAFNLSDGGAYVRWVRMQNKGARGDQSWAYQHHSYALPNAPVIEGTPTVSANDTGTGYTCRFQWKVQSTFLRPIDKIIPQYCFATPDEGMTCPDGASWTSLAPVKPTDETDGAIFTIDRLLSKDQCLFVRANAEHDKIGEDTGVTRGVASVAASGYLKDPSGLSYTIGSGYKLLVTATNNSDVEDSILAIIYTDVDTPEEGIIVGCMPYYKGESSLQVQCPPFSSNPSIGVRAIVPNGALLYSTIDGVKHYTVDPLMQSESTIFYGGSIPTAPSDVVVEQGKDATTIRVQWGWSWEDATGAELSWADHDDAWESTAEPSRYEVSSINNSAWNISGVEPGVTWYVRVRFKRDTNDSTTYGPYSDIYAVTPKSSPSIPALELSDSIITPDGSVTATWAYTTTDGTNQGYAEITTAVINSSGLFYGKYELSSDTEVDDNKVYFEYDDEDDEYTEVTPAAGDDPSEEGWYEIVDNIIAHTETAQHITINANDPLINWQAGETYLLCVRVVSMSGARCEAWSPPRAVTVAEPLNCAITATSLTEVQTTTKDEEEQTVTETVAALTVLNDNTPLTITVTGAGDYGTTLVAIERAATFLAERPDGLDLNGFEGETIALIEQTGEDPITITPTNLIGRLDDGAKYRIVATVMDELGQVDTTSTVTINNNAYDVFYVLWAHQAIVPEATAVIDTDYNVAKITATAPTGTLTGDTFDIYRLSADKPELIVQGGTWGTTYVDPYPAIGEYGGHRVVFRTYNDDYTTVDSEPAWVDLQEDEGDILDLDYSIIDFSGNELEVRYNMELSSAFAKDFTETKYLGGSVVGDWNAAVSRTGSVKAVCLTDADQETIETVRALATYAGICHVRTKDGSSFAADVQVSDDLGYDTAGKVFKFTLTVTRVDPEGLDGMTLDDWEAQL